MPGPSQLECMRLKVVLRTEAEVRAALRGQGFSPARTAQLLAVSTYFGSLPDSGEASTHTTDLETLNAHWNADEAQKLQSQFKDGGAPTWFLRSTLH